MTMIWEPALPEQLDVSQALRYLGAPDCGDGAPPAPKLSGRGDDAQRVVAPDCGDGAPPAPKLFGRGDDAQRVVAPDRGEDALRALLQRAERALRDAAKPRAVSLRAGRQALAACLGGEDLESHLKGCEECVLLACTLGAGVDAVQRAANAADMAYAVVLDALASALAEQIADAAEDALRGWARGEGLFLTGRFSPGYGDYPIALQNELLRLLDAPRRIGLGATPTHLLAPRKSITAVLGLAGHPVTGRRAGCAHCALRGCCAYRKEGKTCE